MKDMDDLIYTFQKLIKGILPNVKVRVVLSSKIPSGILGFTRACEDYYEIVLANNISLDQKVFTLFHEIGHIIQRLSKKRIIKRSEIPDLLFLNNKINPNDYLFVLLCEYFADFYARESLDSYIFSDIRSYIDNAWKEIKDMRKNIKKKIYENVEKIADTIDRLYCSHKIKNCENLYKLLSIISNETGFSLPVIHALLNLALYRLKKRGRIKYWRYINGINAEKLNLREKELNLKFTEKILGKSCITEALKKEIILKQLNSHKFMGYEIFIMFLHPHYSQDKTLFNSSFSEGNYKGEFNKVSQLNSFF